MNDGADVELTADRCEVECLHPEHVGPLLGKVVSGTEADELAAIFELLADPTRARLLHALSLSDELCVCDLMAVLKLPQSTISRHLAYLKRSCWVDTRRQGVWMYYTLSRESCTICRELLQILMQHAGSLPEAASDRNALAAFLKDKPVGCS